MRYTTCDARGKGRVVVKKPFYHIVMAQPSHKYLPLEAVEHVKLLAQYHKTFYNHGDKEGPLSFHLCWEQRNLKHTWPVLTA
jgi:hypothetical protein